MSDDDRSPGVGPLTWVTLGLLAFSWLVLSGLTVQVIIRIPPTGSNLLISVAIWLFMAGPHLMFGAAAWRSRGRPSFITPALIGAILYAVMASVIGAVVVLDAPPGRAMNQFVQIALCMYLFGWPLGVVAVQFAYARSQPPAPPVNDVD